LLVLSDFVTALDKGEHQPQAKETQNKHGHRTAWFDTMNWFALHRRDSLPIRRWI
jgi:hypothetical protein